MAGAREMMRYRRNRNEQGGAPLPQGQPIPAYGAAPTANNSWAVYQQAAQSKPGQQVPSQQLQQQQQQAPAQQGGIPLRKVNSLD